MGMVLLIYNIIIVTNSSNGIQKHERSQLHISSVLKLKMFGKTRNDLQLDE